jgi:hypothetical protein
MLRIGLEGDVEPELLVSEGIALKPGRLEQRFEHYEVLQSEDGKLIELGRGSMGVTYKAIDIHLQCPVTLKVINEKYLRNKLARTRFLREARMAASLRHPNVASVFYLGRREDVTSTRWSSWREKRSRSLFNVPGGWR